MADSKLTALTALTDPQLTDLLYMVDDPSGTPVSKKATVQTVLALSFWAPPEGMRLSAQNNTYIPTTDQTAVGTLYWTPVISGGEGVVTGFDGTTISRKIVSQKSLALTITADKNYDVFYDYDGDVLALSAAWTDNTTRADALGNEDGAVVLGSDHTKLWLGTIRASATDKIEDSSVKRFVWNAYNRVSRQLSVIETTASWTYTVDTVWRQVRASTANQVAYVIGQAGASNLSLDAREEAVPDNTAAVPHGASTAIATDSTTTPDARCVCSYITNPLGAQTVVAPSASLHCAPDLGYHVNQWLELQADPVSTTFLGKDATPRWQPGLSGTIDA